MGKTKNQGEREEPAGCGAGDAAWGVGTGGGCSSRIRRQEEGDRPDSARALAAGAAAGRAGGGCGRRWQLPGVLSHLWATLRGLGRAKAAGRPGCGGDPSTALGAPARRRRDGEDEAGGGSSGLLGARGGGGSRWLAGGGVEGRGHRRPSTRARQRMQDTGGGAKSAAPARGRRPEECGDSGAARAAWHDAKQSTALPGAGAGTLEKRRGRERRRAATRVLTGRQPGSGTPGRRGGEQQNYGRRKVFDAREWRKGEAWSAWRGRRGRGGRVSSAHEEDKDAWLWAVRRALGGALDWEWGRNGGVVLRRG
uniref:Uncharacterized protein n=1 Tax=Oryza punctata TaxID=4537 RepID=A0A0E0LBR5_ORYPU